MSQAIGCILFRPAKTGLLGGLQAQEVAQRMAALETPEHGRRGVLESRVGVRWRWMEYEWGCGRGGRALPNLARARRVGTRRQTEAKVARQGWLPGRGQESAGCLREGRLPDKQIRAMRGRGTSATRACVPRRLGCAAGPVVVPQPPGEGAGRGQALRGPGPHAAPGWGPTKHGKGLRRDGALCGVRAPRTRGGGAGGWGGAEAREHTGAPASQ